MRMNLKIALLLSLVITPASAKDITLTLNDDQQKAFLQLLDVAQKAGGLAFSKNVVFFYDLLIAAQVKAEAPIKPEPTK